MPRIGRNGFAQTSVLSGMTGGWQTCLLTWYDPALGGTNSASGKADAHSRTASGEPYDPNAYTCAAPPNYAFGTTIAFRYGGTEITCKVNDRGGAIQGNHFDLSRAAARDLGIIGAGRTNATFQVTGASGASRAAQNQVTTAQQAGSGGGGGPSSILDLLTSPVNEIGGWLAQIAINLAKDAVIGFADVVIIPAWHWNLRAVDRYQSDMFSDSSGKQLLWTAAFWGGGYWLLFTDPDQKSLAPAPVRRSRLARHTRSAQALPARQSLVKPKDVKSKTPKKPNPVVSRAEIIQTGTMATTRTQRVKVTGTHAANPESSDLPLAPGNTEPAAEINGRSKPTAIPNARDRTRTHSLPHSGRDSQRGSGPRGTSRSQT